MHRKPELLRHGAPSGARERLEIEPALPALDLPADDDRLRLLGREAQPILDSHGEDRSSVGCKGLVGGAHSELDVLRIVLASPDDDDVLEPPCDEQLSILQEAEIAGPAGSAGRPPRAAAPPNEALVASGFFQ